MDILQSTIQDNYKGYVLYFTSANNFSSVLLCAGVPLEFAILCKTIPLGY